MFSFLVMIGVCATGIGAATAGAPGLGDGGESSNLICLFETVVESVNNI